MTSPTSCQTVVGCICVNPNGSRYWRLKYRLHGKEKTFSLGVYPAVSLADVRKDALEAKRQVGKGVYSAFLLVARGQSSASQSPVQGQTSGFYLRHRSSVGHVQPEIAQYLLQCHIIR